MCSAFQGRVFYVIFVRFLVYCFYLATAFFLLTACEAPDITVVWLNKINLCWTYLNVFCLYYFVIISAASPSQYS